ncbi:transposase [Prosthecodimorpha hirschii]|uniref:transposase n=1 Tax=Prosthecodimorpha hirschii TaxID=665126 RepID=UPI0015E2D83B
MSGLDPRLEPLGEVRRFEVINGALGRRRWTADDRARIVGETLEPGAVVSEVARRHGLTPQQVFAWRREARNPRRRHHHRLRRQGRRGRGRRVAREVGGLFKVIGSTGVIVPKGAGLSASGQALPPIAVTYGLNVISWDLAPDAGRPPFAEVTGRWTDRAVLRFHPLSRRMPDRPRRNHATSRRTRPRGRPP